MIPDQVVFKFSCPEYHSRKCQCSVDGPVISFLLLWYAPGVCAFPILIPVGFLLLLSLEGCTHNDRACFTNVGAVEASGKFVS